MEAIRRRAWCWRVSPSSSIARGTGGEGRRVQRTCSSRSSTITSGTTTLSATRTTASDSVGEQPRDLHPLPTPAPAPPDKGDRATKLEHIKGLVDEFISADHGGTAGGVERWLLELGVGWVLQVAVGDDEASQANSILVPRQLRRLTRSWILALREICTSIWTCYSGLCSLQAEANAGPTASEFVRFAEATLLKMLNFVRAIAAPLNIDDPSCAVAIDEEKLLAMIDVRDAASEHILTVLSLYSSPHLQSTRTTDEMRRVLSPELDRLDRAICDSMDEIGARIMSFTTNDDPSPDIHKVTRSVVSHIELLLGRIGAETISYTSLSPVTYKIIEMVWSLETKLDCESRSFPDHSLRFLFLINNSYFIWKQLHKNRLLYGLTSDVHEYIQSYLQVSWTPVLKCLHDPAIQCFKRSSPLQKFESKFRKTYAAQKLWKVPDPVLRKRLREAISEKVISGFTKSLKDNDVIAPRVTPQELKEMLQELFEG